MVSRETAHRKEVGERIKALRRELPGRVTQERLAEELGLSRGTVAAWERGHQMPYGENITKLSRRLGATPAHILYGGAAAPDLAERILEMGERWRAASEYLRSKGDATSLEEADALIRCAEQVREVVERYRSGEDLKGPLSDPERVAERGRESIGEVPPEALQD